MARLLAFKKQAPSVAKETLSKQHLIVGCNLFSLCLYKELTDRFGPSEVAILSEHPITPDLIFPRGPTPLRGNANTQMIQILFPNIKIDQTRTPVFLKESKWRSFNERVKPQKFLWCEEFFSHPGIKFNPRDIYPFLSDQNFFDLANENRLPHLIENLITPSSLNCANGPLINCEYLYWAKSLDFFLRCCQNPQDIPQPFVQFCKDSKGPITLLVSFEFEKPITDKKETLFIPLSASYERGHFIGEFSSLPGNCQKAEFITYLDPQEASEEDVSKKIRILKRNMRRLFSAQNFEESVVLTESPCSLNIDDEILSTLKKAMPNFRIVGSHAPLENCNDLSGLSFFARGAANLCEIIDQI